MTDATPTHASTSPVLYFADFYGTDIRVTKHPAHGRMMMANDVIKALGYAIKVGGTRTILNGLKVSDANRILLKGEDFDTSGGKKVPTFTSATFLTRGGLDQLVAGAAAKKVVRFGPWMADVMDNGIQPKKKPAKVAVEAASVPAEGLPWE